mmetsp:Transcript_11031/g.19943  ORF Transcript_11031/g.19943 Transcript_11031/m.19943 type:complete len:313 (-) Transcript_11031:2474-3412(-)
MDINEESSEVISIQVALRPIKFNNSSSSTLTAFRTIYFIPSSQTSTTLLIANLPSNLEASSVQSIVTRLLNSSSPVSITATENSNPWSTCFIAQFASNRDLEAILDPEFRDIVTDTFSELIQSTSIVPRDLEGPSAWEKSLAQDFAADESALLKYADEVVAEYEKEEVEEKQKVKEMRNIVDEDGFTLVVDPGRTNRSAARSGDVSVQGIPLDKAKKLVEEIENKKKRSAAELASKDTKFYAFHRKISKTKRIENLQEQFQKDKKKLREFQQRKRQENERRNSSRDQDVNRRKRSKSAAPVVKASSGRLVLD